LDYGQWCEQMRDWLELEPRRGLAGPLRDRLLAIDPQAPLDASLLQQLRRDWTDFLQRSRSEAGLSRNQPGRFLLPGSGIAAEMLLFVPLLAGNRHTAAGAGSWWAECEARFRYYRDFVVKGFYDEHFSRLDRQILLVDMLSPMDAGQAALSDLKGALEAVLQSFRYGRNSLWRRFWQPRISRLAVCATKVDQVSAEQQRAVQQCLEDLLTDSLSDVRHGGVEVRGFPLAAVRATRQEGDALVAGLQGQTGWVRYQPGSIPTHLPLDLHVAGPELLEPRPDRRPPASSARRVCSPHPRFASRSAPRLPGWTTHRRAAAGPVGCCAWCWSRYWGWPCGNGGNGAGRPGSGIPWPEQCSAGWVLCSPAPVSRPGPMSGASVPDLPKWNSCGWKCRRRWPIRASAWRWTGWIGSRRCMRT